MKVDAPRTGVSRRQEIVAATAKLLDRIGLADIRVVDVAEAMGVSTALIFYHFRSKDALVAEAMAHSFAKVLADLDAALVGDDPLAKLRRVCAMFDGPDAVPGWQIWTGACALALREPEMRRRLQAIDRRYLNAFSQIFAEGTATGVFTCADPMTSAVRLLAFNDGLATAIMVLGTVTRRQLVEWMLAQVAIEVGVDVQLLVTP